MREYVTISVRLAYGEGEPEGTLERKCFEIRAKWDDEAGMWWCSNDELPLTTEGPTFEQLVSRVLEIAPEIAAENGLAAPGDEIEVHVIAERVQSVSVVAAAGMPRLSIVSCAAP
jgi:Domain of unknown function (DUF1902)